MNSQELLARTVIEASRNPELDKLLTELAPEVKGNANLFFVDDQKAFAIYGEDGQPSGEWIFYLYMTLANGKWQVREIVSS